MKTALIASALAGVLTFSIKYWIDYRSLVAKQPVNGVLPADFTSFPPTAAWITALPWAIGVAVVIFVVVFLVRK